ncbi:hypothetical protein LOK49_LG05G01170 [Camellia lanceoleosa]|uniref:Uncharacterized protein n=1 Tax=Camellia lanceoleosa TaxID=1840588 RepID=A0ACC0HNJ5_9ERIC|nr:hypothetical protein LOK49_LG05G01170 [Camellia lanceoleosa]
MDEELVELQRQFEFAQQAKSSIRLSERNVVELVQKLQQLQIIDFDLLHTVSGKEYITPEQLRLEIVAEIKKLGRVSVIDLADTIGVDLYYVEKQSQHIVSNDSSLMLINGEIISNSYWDTVAEEINERLQECSQIALAELAAQLQVGSELIANVLEPRLGTLVKGRLEGGQLYTPAYVARVNAMVRGAARGITVPMNLSALWSSLQLLLHEMDGASGVALESSFFQTLFNGLVKDGEILGSLRAAVHWTPTVFAIAQKESVDSFFSQNSFISYDLLHKLGIPQPIQYLQSRYPEGIPLVTIFVHPSMIEMLDSASEDAIERGSWIDSLLILPASFGSQDASKILSLCRSVQVALKSNKAILLGESYVVSAGFVKPIPAKLKKNQRKGKDTSSLQMLDAKSGAKKESDKKKEENLSLSEEWLIQKIILLVPEFEEQGMDDPETILRPLANHLRPMLLNSWKERRKVALTENAQRIKHLLDNLQRKIDESFLNMQLYEKALDLFEDDQSTSVILHRHLLRTTATSMMDTLLLNLDMLNKLKTGIEVEESQNSEPASLSSGERLTLAKSLPGPLSVKAVAVVEASEGKQVETFMTALRDIAEESGLTLKKLDKKLERTLLHSYRKDLTSQVSAETDPVLLLAKVVSLLYIQVHNKALQALGDKLDDSAYKILMDYHSATVTLLALMSAATGDDEDCTSDRILSKRELLEGLMPALKGLVVSTSQS